MRRRISNADCIRGIYFSAGVRYVKCVIDTDFSIGYTICDSELRGEADIGFETKGEAYESGGYQKNLQEYG